MQSTNSTSVLVLVPGVKSYGGGKRNRLNAHGRISSPHTQKNDISLSILFTCVFTTFSFVVVMSCVLVCMGDTRYFVWGKQAQAISRWTRRL